MNLADWPNAQQWESKWHGDCANSYHEETKQFVYANRMGLDQFKREDYGRISFDFGDKNIIDIGGGAYSILLKSKARHRTVIDPCNYPNWVSVRYFQCGIDFKQVAAETIDIINLKEPSAADALFDIALIYNCLQHVVDPKKIIDNVRSQAKEIRIFEWIDTGTSEGHLHDLKEDKLNEWLHGRGKIEYMQEKGCYGKAYYGIFPTSPIALK